MELNRRRLDEVLTQMRAVQGKQAPAVPDPASNATDDGMRDALNARGADQRTLSDMLAGLGRRELQELTALMYVGRGDFEPSEWDSVLRRVAEDPRLAAVDRLLDEPLLAENVEDGFRRVVETASAEPGS